MRMSNEIGLHCPSMSNMHGAATKRALNIEKLRDALIIGVNDKKQEEQPVKKFKVIHRKQSLPVKSPYAQSSNRPTDQDDLYKHYKGCFSKETATMTVKEALIEKMDKFQ